MPTTALLQNTLIPNLENLMINKLNETEININENITLSEQALIKEIHASKIEILNKLNENKNA